MSIAHELAEAILISRRGLERGPDEARAAVSLRAPLLASAAKRRERGEPWGEEEENLMHELMAVDVELIQALWQPSADAFAWLAGRAPDRVAEMPHLRQLAGL